MSAAADPAPLALAFRRWASDPARTDDELFPAELLVKHGRDLWNIARKIYRPHDWQAESAARRERRYNPAYRFRLDPDDLDATVEFWERITHLYASSTEERPVRDLSVFRFFPHFKTLDCCIEMTDLAGLAGLHALEHLNLWDRVGATTDFRPLAGLPALRALWLHLAAPWPDLTALGSLPVLHDLRLSVNLLALANVPVIAHAIAVHLQPHPDHKTPPRSLRALPILPDACRVVVHAVADLDGAAERFPAVVNLDLQGTFRDLSPLADLPGVTFLRLEGERFTDLRPLARMPALREVLFVRETPFDLDLLTEAPHLREVRVERCDILRTELAAVHAALTPPEEDFGVPEPRPLPPLRFLSYEPQHDAIKAIHIRRNAARTAAGGDYAELPPFGTDAAAREAEARWAQAALHRRLDALLGAGWQTPGSFNHHGHLNFRRYRDCRRVDEIIATLRDFLAACRYPTPWRLIFEPHGDAAEDLDSLARRQNAEAGDRASGRVGPDTPGEDWLVRFDRLYDRRAQDRREWIRQRRDQYAFLEAAHRLRLRRESGLPVDPAEFSPDAPAPAHPKSTPANIVADAADADDDDVEEESPWSTGGDDDDDDDEGGLAIAPPPEDGNDLQSDLAKDLSFQVLLTENILWVPEHMRENAEALIGLEAEDWHALPEPPGQRPEPE